VKQLICCGTGKLITKICRDGVLKQGNKKVPKQAGAFPLDVSIHRTLLYPLKKLKQEGQYRLVALEQTASSTSLYEYKFHRSSAIVVGNEKMGLSPDILAIVDDVVEIPVYGMPYSYNVSHAIAMILYEYCKQYPKG